MKFTMTLTSLFLVLPLSMTSLVGAFPVTSRDVFEPPILSPAQGDVWLIGQNRTVTWDTSSPPPQITNTKGRIMLRKGEQTLNVTLADNFDILSGAADVTVPDVASGDDYRVVLFGGSGNWSPPFTIQTL